MLEQNHKVACSFKSQVPYSGCKFRDLCFEALEASGVAEKRSVSICTSDFFKLLLEFHKRTIYFQNATELQQSGAEVKHGALEGEFWAGALRCRGENASSWAVRVGHLRSGRTICAKCVPGTDEMLLVDEGDADLSADSEEE